jgi:hypothetical protein
MTDISSMLPVLKDFYGKKYMPKSAHKRARKTAAEKILKDIEKRRRKNKES